MKSNDKKTAVVIGGSSGIGLSVAQKLAGDGCRVFVGGRSLERFEEIRETLHGDVAFFQVDALDRAELSRAFESIGDIDFLVNSATPRGRVQAPFPELSLDDFQKPFDKLWGYINSVHLALDYLAPSGSIVLISGSPARKCPPGASALSTVGNAVEGFIRAIAPEIAPRRINGVSPGLIDTPLFDVSGEARQQFFNTVCSQRVIPRVGRPEEVADAVYFLLHNEFVTGTVVDVDGGALLP